jgi:endonuclease/exonuclease/phosphatase family metal-dependent hydrolase
MKALQIDTTEGHSRPTLKPEERLLLAVVDSAYWDLRSPDPARNRTARSYFLEDNDQHAFSFVAICQHFSWSPASIRSQLQALLNVQEAANPAGSEVPNGRKASGIAAAR